MKSFYTQEERDALAGIVECERKAQKLHDELRKTHSEESIIFQLHLERVKRFATPLRKKERWTEREDAFAARAVLEQRDARWLYYRLGGSRTYSACIARVQTLRYKNASTLRAIAEKEVENV